MDVSAFRQSWGGEKADKPREIAVLSTLSAKKNWEKGKKRPEFLCLFPNEREKKGGGEKEDAWPAKGYTHVL